MAWVEADAGPASAMTCGVATIAEFGDSDGHTGGRPEDLLDRVAAVRPGSGGGGMEVECLLGLANQRGQIVV